MSFHSSVHTFEGSEIDPDLPVDPATGKVYHLACTPTDVADNFIFVGDPGRVDVVAEHFDKNSVTHRSMNREIKIVTGAYKGVPVTCLSTGMGTDNVEIVLNEIHALKEFNVKTHVWDKNGAEKAHRVRIIRVGTCGSPKVDASLGELAITRYSIGMDNTGRYYSIPKTPETEKLVSICNEQGPFAAVGGVYATKAHPSITASLVKATHALKNKRPHSVGITATASGFYACQGRIIGRFAGNVTIPTLLHDIGSVKFQAPEGLQEVVNIEMETSSLCGLSNILGFRAGTVAVVVAKRAGERTQFANHDEMVEALNDAIRVGLNAVIDKEIISEKAGKP